MPAMWQNNLYSTNWRLDFAKQTKGWSENVEKVGSEGQLRSHIVRISTDVDLWNPAWWQQTKDAMSHTNWNLLYLFITLTVFLTCALVNKVMDYIWLQW